MTVSGCLTYSGHCEYSTGKPSVQFSRQELGTAWLSSSFNLQRPQHCRSTNCPLWGHADACSNHAIRKGIHPLLLEVFSDPPWSLPSLEMSFLDLPYDVRHHIYSYIFPRASHLFLHATDTGLVYLPKHDDTIPKAFLQSCGALHQEASEYLSNGYIFNVAGMKLDCVKQYGRIEGMVGKYARDRVYVRAFSNGLDSSTGCISIMVGDAKLKALEERGRGQPMTIRDLEREGKYDLKQKRAQRSWTETRPVQSLLTVLWWTVIPAAMPFGLAICWIIVQIQQLYRSFRRR